MTVVGRLRLADYGMHLADQIILVRVPLVATIAFEHTDILDICH